MNTLHVNVHYLPLPISLPASREQRREGSPMLSVGGAATQSALDIGEHIHSRTQSTFHSNHDVRYGQLTSRDLNLKHHLGTWLPIHHSRRPHSYTVLRDAAHFDSTSADDKHFRRCN